MSFRARLICFFILILVVPMAAVGFLVFRLINDSESGRADARASGIAAGAMSTYQTSSTSASVDASTLARDIGLTSGSKLELRVRAIARELGLERVTIEFGSHRLDIGDRTAIAPGVALVSPPGRARHGRSRLRS